MNPTELKRSTQTPLLGKRGRPPKYGAPMTALERQQKASREFQMLQGLWDHKAFKAQKAT